MKKLLPYILLYLFSTALFADEKEEEKDPTFTITQGGVTTEVKASENPALKQLYDQIKEKSAGIKEQYGVEDPPAQQENDAAATPQADVQAKPKLQGSRSVADEAYKSGDYETAYEHYRALSAEGDAEASKTLAVMHSEGKGVEKDTNATIAYFARAAEQGDRDAQQLMDKTYFTEKQRKGIDGSYKTISEELDEPETSGGTEGELYSAQYQGSHYGGTGSASPIGYYVPINNAASAGTNTLARQFTGQFVRAPANSYSQILARNYEPRHNQLEKEFSPENFTHEDN